jgi:hypothetical protein
MRLLLTDDSSERLLEVVASRERQSIGDSPLR